MQRNSAAKQRRWSCGQESDQEIHVLQESLCRVKNEQKSAQKYLNCTRAKKSDKAKGQNSLADCSAFLIPCRNSLHRRVTSLAPHHIDSQFLCFSGLSAPQIELEYACLAGGECSYESKKQACFLKKHLQMDEFKQWLKCAGLFSLPSWWVVLPQIDYLRYGKLWTESGMRSRFVHSQKISPCGSLNLLSLPLGSQFWWSQMFTGIMPFYCCLTQFNLQSFRFSQVNKLCTPPSEWQLPIRRARTHDITEHTTQKKPHTVFGVRKGALVKERNTKSLLKPPNSRMNEWQVSPLTAETAETRCTWYFKNPLWLTEGALLTPTSNPQNTMQRNESPFWAQATTTGAKNCVQQPGLRCVSDDARSGSLAVNNRVAGS